MLPPTEDGKPVDITVQVNVLQLSDFQTDRFTYDIEFTLRQWWNDRRLSRNIHEKNATKADDKEKNQSEFSDYEKDIWVPHLFVPNSLSLLKEGDRTVFVDIDRDGNIFRSERKKLRLVAVKSFLGLGIRFGPTSKKT